MLKRCGQLNLCSDVACDSRDGLMAAALIAGRFELVAKIGQGSFGDLFQGVDREERGADVAVKLEHVRSAKPQLRHEHGVYQSLAGAQGFAQARWYGAEGDFRVLVLDLLGPNLQQLLAFCGGRFSLKTVLMLADQMIARLETLHDRGVIHCDVKPHNFLMGLPDTPSADTVFLVDMGLAHFYLCVATTHSLQFDSLRTWDLNKKKILQRPSDGKALRMRAKEFDDRDASVRKRFKPKRIRARKTRRLGIAALCAALFAFGRLAVVWRVGFDAIAEGAAGFGHQIPHSARSSLRRCSSCVHLPQKEIQAAYLFQHTAEFAEFLKRCRGLGFEERPPYDQLRALFQSRFDTEGFVRDGVWDWTLVRLKIFEDSLVERAWEQSCCHKR